jgi:hypothetical protein
MKANFVWNKSRPLVDSSGIAFSSSHPAVKYLRKKGFNAINPYLLRRFKYWKQLSNKGNSPDIDGYLLALVNDITGLPLGFQSIALDKNGSVVDSSTGSFSQFAPGDQLSGAIRILDTPDRSHLNITGDLVSGLAVSILTGKRTWSATMAASMSFMEIPSGFSNVWVWKAKGTQFSEGLDGSSYSDLLAHDLITSGVETVHIMDLANSDCHTWGEAFQEFELRNTSSREEMFNKCLEVGTYTQATSFGYTKIA